jgi:hypothetical protein
LRVPRGSVAANSVVTTLPRITAPASRNATTMAASRPVRQPTNRGEPCSVGMSAVSMMSLMPSGMPSIGDNGRPSRQRAAERSAAARAAAISWQTNAPTAGSNFSTCKRQRSRNSRGVSLPAAKFAAAEKNGIGCGNVANFGVSDRRFRFKPAGDFGGNRQAVSVQIGTPLRLQAAIAIAQSQKARSFELRAALSLAKLYRAANRDADAHAVLAPAVEDFPPTRQFPELTAAQALLSALSR